jgi:preprotein translocase subunit SecA
MERGLKEDYVTYIYRIENVQLREEPEMQQFSYSGGEDPSTQPSERPNTPRQAGNKVGRNDPCPCGSGKKYKKCGLLNTPEHKRLMAENGGPEAQAG